VTDPDNLLSNRCITMPPIEAPLKPTLLYLKNV